MKDLFFPEKHNRRLLKFQIYSFVVTVSLVIFTIFYSSYCYPYNSSYIVIFPRYFSIICTIYHFVSLKLTCYSSCSICGPVITSSSETIIPASFASATAVAYGASDFTTGVIPALRQL